jgi:hypothetical protein
MAKLNENLLKLLFFFQFFKIPQSAISTICVIYDCINITYTVQTENIIKWFIMQMVHMFYD